MNAVAIMRGLARNNAWANHRLAKACGRLSSDALHAKRTSFFPTIMMTLNHIVIVDWYYVDAFLKEGRGRAVFAKEEHTFDELAPLVEAQRAVDLKLISYVESMKSDDALDAEVALERKDHIQRERAGDVLLHLFEHQVHHRGQVHAMLAGTDVPPPQLDEFFMREELPLREKELVEMGLPLA